SAIKQVRNGQLDSKSSQRVACHSDSRVRGQITRDSVEELAELIAVALREVVSQDCPIGIESPAAVELCSRDGHCDQRRLKIVLIGDRLESGLHVERSPNNDPARRHLGRAVVGMKAEQYEFLGVDNGRRIAHRHLLAEHQRSESDRPKRSQTVTTEPPTAANRTPSRLIARRSMLCWWSERTATVARLTASRK